MPLILFEWIIHVICCWFWDLTLEFKCKFGIPICIVYYCNYARYRVTLSTKERKKEKNEIQSNLIILLFMFYLAFCLPVCLSLSLSLSVWLREKEKIVPLLSISRYLINKVSRKTKTFQKVFQSIINLINKSRAQMRWEYITNNKKKTFNENKISSHDTHSSN